MDLRSSVSQVRVTVTHLLFRLLTGRYSRKAGIGIGFGGAVLIAVVGYVAGPAVEPIVTDSPVVPPLMFTTGDLTVLWGVHATVITLSLVGLSFAWNSVKNLPTMETIVGEIAYRLRSIETITFLLTANLCIGAGVLLATDDFVTADIGTATGALLVVSVGVTVHRFWIVFDLLLHNTLDEKVFDFADAALSGKSRATANEYDVYLGHFFDASRTEIERDRPERLREKLRRVEELLDRLLASDSELKEDEGFWEYVYGRYDAIYRQSVTQQNPELEKKVIASLSGVFWKTRNYGDPGLVEQTVQCFARLFARGYDMKPQSTSTEFLLDRFENAQNAIFRQFQNADDDASLEVATAQVNGLLETHTSLWRTAVEYEAVGAMDYLRHMLDDVYQFQEHTYAPPQTIREARNLPEDSLEARKQEQADEYRDAISHLKFATYGWALNLFEEEDVSEYFIEQVLTEYVEQDFGSANALSEMYFEMGEATEPLNYWERWNIDRELEKSYGVASAGMAIHTWLLRFYCTALVWIMDSEEAIDNLEARDPEDSPLTEHDHIQNRVDKIIDRLESYRDDYSLDDVLSGGPSTDERCDALIEYFEAVKAVLDEQEQNWIRALPIGEDYADSYGESLNSQLDSCVLRTAIEEVGDITQVESLEQDANAEFTLYSSSVRKAFVDDGIPTFFNSNFSGIMDKYRGLVLDYLDFEEREVDAAADVADALAEVVSEEDVALIVAEEMEVARTLRDDERSDRISNDDLRSYLAFQDVPVLRDVTTEFAALALFDEEFDYVEEVKGYPIAVEVTAGEDVDDWDPEELSGEEDIRDYVHIEASYNAHIETSEPTGVVYRIREQEY
ncbi:hypothetical protein [Natronomonas marina]|uniref:hypothetical protein n=1 Tax=Natronomonas marina TaxID=2961939 RepID=UPI0020C96455|nr:hypothetical protein [Natronomonas marina]